MLLATFSCLPRNVDAANDLSQVAYYDLVKGALNLTSTQEDMLRNYGFATIQTSWKRFEDFYLKQVYNPDLPVFVTTDSILHLFHVAFDSSLRIVEYQVLYPMIFNITQYAFQKSLQDYNSIPHDGSATYWAVRNATVYFAVAMSLISGENASVPSSLTPDTFFFLNELYSKIPRYVLAGYWRFPEPPYNVEVRYDFTQFTLRGHYLGVPRLEQYFRTMMWYGNFPIFVHRIDDNYTWIESHIDEETLVYMRDILKQNSTQYYEWNRLYNVTSALVGESDSINLLNLETALHTVFGDQAEYLNLTATPEGLTELRNELAKPIYAQKILGQALCTLIDPAALPRYPIVFQFMGQRYVPDSYMFQMLCWDKIGKDQFGVKRILPKGLDVFAVLGSERAYQLLIPDYAYENYTENLAALKSTFSNLTENEWRQSSYTSWVHSLQSLVNVEEYSDNYPDFMRNLAWQDEKLNTALGSWAQLRHDTLLYAKETYIPAYAICSYPEAFVEPYPTFYSRMQELIERTITAINMLPSKKIAPIPISEDWSMFPSTIILDTLATIKDVTQKLETISNKELAQQPLSMEEIDFLKRIAYSVNGCGGSNPTGWYTDTINNIASAANYTDLLDVPLIADVATFPPGDWEYPPQILHVGVGNINALVVLYPMNNGTLAAAVGPVFSYYEFPLIGTKRLNDDEWKTMLTWSNRTAYLPTWVQDVYGLSAPFVPESATLAVLVAFMAVTTVVLTKKFRTKRRERR